MALSGSAVTPSRAVILQASRFHYAAGANTATKHRYGILLDLFIDVECFIDGLSCRSSVPYLLNSVVIHLGETPTSGHNQTLPGNANTQSFHPAVELTAEAVTLMNQDTYLSCISNANGLSRLWVVVPGTPFVRLVGWRMCIAQPSRSK